MVSATTSATGCATNLLLAIVYYFLSDFREEFVKEIADNPEVFPCSFTFEIDIQLGPDILVIFSRECVDEPCPLCFIGIIESDAQFVEKIIKREDLLGHG